MSDNKPLITQMVQKRGLNISELAKKLDISRTSLYDLSNPDKPSTAAMLNLVCAELKCAPQDIMPLSKLAQFIGGGWENSGQVAVIGSSAFHRAKLRGMGQDMAGLAAELCIAFWRYKHSLPSAKQVGDLAKELAGQDGKKVVEVVWEVLTDPVVVTLRGPSDFDAETPSVFLISPVRTDDEELKRLAERHTKMLEQHGVKVHSPIRDTYQEEPHGFGIVCHNIDAISRASEIHVLWHPKSQGIAADLQVAMALSKPTFLINFEGLEPMPEKSYTNVMLLVDAIWRETLERQGLDSEGMAIALSLQ